jgi:DNA-binding protein YbaB
MWGHLIWIWISVNRKVFHVEFDDEFIYVIQKKQDILIPLENIKDVEIVSLGGVYKVTLYSKDQLGDLIYFKPSLLYPFNFKAKDELVDVLRHAIDEAKKKIRVYQKNALYS